MWLGFVAAHYQLNAYCSDVKDLPLEQWYAEPAKQPE